MWLRGSRNLLSFTSREKRVLTTKPLNHQTTTPPNLYSMKTILATSLAAVVSIGALHAETVVSNPEGRLSVRFCRDNLVHFRYAPNGTEFVPEDTYVLRQAIEKKDSDYAPVSVKESRSSGSISLAGERLKVSVDSKTLGISITADGREVFRSAAEAFASNGEGRTARFVRDVACEESFMGLGNIPGTDFKSLELREALGEREGVALQRRAHRQRPGGAPAAGDGLPKGRRQPRGGVHDRRRQARLAHRRSRGEVVVSHVVRGSWPLKHSNEVIAKPCVYGVAIASNNSSNAPACLATSMRR